MIELDKLVKSILSIDDVGKVEVTAKQLQSLEALAVAYMAIAVAGLDKDSEQTMMAIIDTKWDSLFKVKDDD